MGRRRQFGSVRKLPSGRWQARYETEGGRSITARRTFPSRAEAGRWLASVETDQARGAWVDPRAGKTPFADYARIWLGGQARITRRTREIYEAQLRLHVLPVIHPDVCPLGEVALADLTPDLVRDWYAALVACRSPSVAAKAYTRLRQILTAALNDDRIAKNPCRIAQGGVEHHPEQRFVTMAELHQLAEATPDRYRALILTAGLAGLRAGELFALRWVDVDLDDAVITVRRKRLRLASGEVIEDDPKSRADRRRVALPASLVAELRRHRAMHGEVAEPDDYVFTSATSVPMERSNFRSRVWLPATRAAGLSGLRFHDLRHVAATLTTSSSSSSRTGATTKELMARLGHASARASLIYQHAAEDRDRRIAEGLDRMAREAGIGPASEGSIRSERTASLTQSTAALMATEAVSPDDRTACPPTTSGNPTQRCAAYGQEQRDDGPNTHHATAGRRTQPIQPHAGVDEGAAGRVARVDPAGCEPDRRSEQQEAAEQEHRSRFWSHVARCARRSSDGAVSLPGHQRSRRLGPRHFATASRPKRGVRGAVWAVASIDCSQREASADVRR